MSAAGVGFAEKARILKLAEQIQARLFHAQQVKLSGQQSVNPQGHVAQAEEIQRKLTEAVLRLQEAARDYSIQGISKRLETLSRKLNLLFDVQSTSQATSCFLSCADFYLEVGFHDNRLVSSIKLVHTHLSPREPLSLDSVLSDHTYHRLESHLSGLLQVYSQAEGQERGQVFRALSATESVLLSINKHSQSSSLHDTIMTQPLGLLTPRYGGLPMKLTYFQHPHEALTTPPSPDHVTTRDQEVGVSANVLVEKSTQPFLISLDPNLLRFEKQGFDPVTSSNGASLSVTFVLQHMAPIPVCAVIMDRIHSIVFRSQSP
jgi:mediator of RNA polymerase II transcription subunit 1